jgi:diguanylate cyclase (GGDEF)-like protein
MAELAGTPPAPGRAAFARKRRQHQAFALARLLLVALFVGLWVLFLAIGYPMPYGFLIVLALEGPTLVAYRWLMGRARGERGLDLLHYCLLFSELGFHTAIVYLLGGLSWLGAIAYIYAIMYAAAFLSWRGAAIFMVAIVACFMTVITLDSAGVLPHQWYLPQGPDRFRDPEFVITTSVAFVGVLATVTFWMAFVGNEMRRERDEALRVNEALVDVQEQLRALNEELEKKVEERTEALLRRAETDQLTGLLNRGAITRRLQELLALAQRGGRPLAVIIADGDRFKDCNDRGGHPYGDRILQFLARALIDPSRDTDQIGRMGGDEFLLVLPDTDARGAVRLCRRVARYIKEKREETWADLPVPSLSFGIAVYPNCATSYDGLIRTADQAMYRAKREGADRWCLGPGLPEGEEEAARAATG